MDCLHIPKNNYHDYLLANLCRLLFSIQKPVLFTPSSLSSLSLSLFHFFCCFFTLSAPLCNCEIFQFHQHTK